MDNKLSELHAIVADCVTRIGGDTDAGLSEDGSAFVTRGGKLYRVTLEEVATENEMIDCGQCDGTGTTDAMGAPEQCPVCDGSGTIPA